MRLQIIILYAHIDHQYAASAYSSARCNMQDVSLFVCLSITRRYRIERSPPGSLVILLSRTGQQSHPWRGNEVLLLSLTAVGQSIQLSYVPCYQAMMNIMNDSCSFSWNVNVVRVITDSTTVLVPRPVNSSHSHRSKFSSHHTLSHLVGPNRVSSVRFYSTELVTHS